ncbi:MAG: DNA repair protein RadA, partial [Gammaproteobacteria bacterium]|nr:DNA repair protein RadA [Gammaproteobacteria bacterium]
MAKVKMLYVCSSCGASQPKWAGQCADCGEWNTMAETIPQPRSNRTGLTPSLNADVRIQSLDEVEFKSETRTQTG